MEEDYESGSEAYEMENEGISEGELEKAKKLVPVPEAPVKKDGRGRKPLKDIPPEKQERVKAILKKAQEASVASRKPLGEVRKKQKELTEMKKKEAEIKKKELDQEIEAHKLKLAELETPKEEVKIVKKTTKAKKPIIIVESESEEEAPIIIKKKKKPKKIIIEESSSESEVEKRRKEKNKIKEEIVNRKVAEKVDNMKNEILREYMKSFFPS